MSAEARLLIANLDAEIEIARTVTPGPHPPMSSAAARVVGPAATHMALLARPGDRLWLPAPVPPEQLCAAARERGLAIESCPLAEIAPARQICAWAETESVARLRRTGEPGPPRAAEEMADAGDWREALWHLWPPAQVAARVNHRAFALALALARGHALPGACRVHDLAQLSRHLAEGAADPGLDGAWVLKAPLSAAGRERIRHRGAELGRGERVRIGRLLARFGELLFEPWVDRVQDMACAGIVHPGGVRLFPPHLLDNDPRGVFRAAIIDEGSSLASEHRDALRSTAAAAGEALADAGYLGPFSIDAYTWRDRSGALHLQPMSEINARLTFGILGHALP